MRQHFVSFPNALLSVAIFFFAADLYATDYQATCEVVSLNSAVNSAAQSGSPPNTVTLASGCVYDLPVNTIGYNVAPDGSPSYFFNVTNGVTIFGNGATIEFASANSPPRRIFYVASLL